MRGARALGVAVLLLGSEACVTLSAPFPDQLTLTWLGAGGWTLSDGRHLVLAVPSPFLDPLSLTKFAVLLA